MNLASAQKLFIQDYQTEPSKSEILRWILTPISLVEAHSMLGSLMEPRDGSSFGPTPPVTTALSRPTIPPTLLSGTAIPTSGSSDSRPTGFLPVRCQ